MEIVACCFLDRCCCLSTLFIRGECYDVRQSATPAGYGAESFCDLCDGGDGLEWDEVVDEESEWRGWIGGVGAVG